jgi:4-hydroxy-2-oxoheptanedioate aldolase
MSFETAGEMVRAAEAGGAAPLVRVSGNSEEAILHALDIGAHGVIIPHVGSREEAEAAVARAKYHPLGGRGFSPFTPAGGYSLGGVAGHAAAQNARTLVGLILEGREGIEALEEILAIPGIRKKVDLIYIGAYDLSQALGHPGQVDHPEVRRRMQECMRSIREAGIAGGGYVAKDGKDVAWMVESGMQFVTLLPDCTLLFHSLSDRYGDLGRAPGRSRRAKK